MIERKIRLLNDISMYGKAKENGDDRMENLSKQVIESVFDGDLNTKLNNVEYSTSAREVITVGFMVDKLEGDVRA